MLITLARQPTWHETTLGVLFVDGARECYSLEDAVRDGVKIYGETAIPAGRYRIELGWSPAFKRIMPRLQSVPGFEGVLIHWGNSAADTLGCIITGGQVEDAEHVTASRVAFDKLYATLEAADQAGDQIWIDVRNAIQPADAPTA